MFFIVHNRKFVPKIDNWDQISSRSRLLDEMTNRLDANSKQVQRGEEKEGRGRRKVGKGEEKDRGTNG